MAVLPETVVGGRSRQVGSVRAGLRWGPQPTRRLGRAARLEPPKALHPEPGKAVPHLPSASPSQRCFPSRRWLPRIGRTVAPFRSRRPITEGGGHRMVVDVKAPQSNKPINPTHFAASRRLLAQAARRVSRAGYRQR